MFLYTVSCRVQLFVCPSDQKQVRQVYEAGHWICASENFVFKRQKRRFKYTTFLFKQIKRQKLFRFFSTTGNIFCLSVVFPKVFRNFAATLNIN